MATLCACIDIGTNTTRLLVAERTERGLRTVAAEREFVALAEDSSAGSEALVQIVVRQVGSARAHGAGRVRIVGTAALRGLLDRERLCSRITAAAGVPVEVLTPAQEARFAFLGATATLDPARAGEVAVVDVGGGSTEVAVGTVRDRHPRWWASLATGSAVLSREHVHHDPPTPGDLTALREAANAVFSAEVIPRCERAFAVGGSAASLSRIVGPVVTNDAVDRALALLTAAPSKDVAAAHGLDARRVRVLPAGILLLAGAGAALSSPLVVAGGGLREGILLDVAGDPG